MLQMEHIGLAPQPELATIKNAALTPFQVERVDDRRRSVSGAVYMDGRLVSISQRAGGRGGDLVESNDQEAISGQSGFDQLAGKWLYGGHWMGQFGHFIIETLPTLWPRVEVDGIIFHPFIFESSISQWQVTLIRRLGFQVPIFIARQGCMVEELVVPERPVVLNELVAPEAVNVWARVASPPSPSRLVFLSRSRLLGDPRSIDGDERLDDMMAANGFDVIHPQELPIDEQLDVIAGASTLAGVSGSALHLSAFAPPHSEVLELGDARTPHRALPNQRVIDDAIGRQSGFVPFLATDGSRDIERTEQLVAVQMGA